MLVRVAFAWRWVASVSFAVSLALALASGALRAEEAPTPSPPAPPQFVMLAFDGGWSNQFWQDSRAFAAANKVHFTYFVSCVYYLANADKTLYIEPHHGPGRSEIGWGGTPADIAERLRQTEAARQEGHAIASHGCGHFDGGHYTTPEWQAEFTQFNTIMASAWQRYGNGQEPDGWRDYFLKEGYGGFRAPYLSITKAALLPALTDMSFVYDASTPAAPGLWPVKQDGLWEFPLSVLRIAGTGAATLSMDYNFYLAQSGAREGNPANFQHYEDQVYATYMAYFRASYYSNRAPINIGHHFSQWNGGAYWKALQRFAATVCDSAQYPDVKCANYAELVAFLNAHEADLPAYQAKAFAHDANVAQAMPAQKPLTTAEIRKLWVIDPASAHRDRN